MLLVQFSDTSPKRGHRGLGLWGAFLQKFDNGQKTCTIKDVQDYLEMALDKHNSKKGAYEILVSSVTVRRTISRVCELESQSVLDGKATNHYFSKDVRAFGKEIAAGKIFMLEDD